MQEVRQTESTCYVISLIENSRNANKSIVTQSKFTVAWEFGENKEERKGGTTKEHKDNLGDDAYVHSPNCGGCSSGIYTDQTYQIVYVNIVVQVCLSKTIKQTYKQTTLLTLWPE